MFITPLLFRPGINAGVEHQLTYLLTYLPLLFVLM